MLKPRIIPCLLIQDGGLVKTVNFGNPKYVGDPLNTVRIFNEKQVDEIMILDIDATVVGKEPDYALISALASECRMPLCYGGGIKNVEQIEQIISLGVEKVSLSSVIQEDPGLITRAAERVGSQSVVVCLDVKKHWNSYRIFTHHGKKRIKADFLPFVQQMERLGAGELVINVIDRDGTMTGYDQNLIAGVWEKIGIPLTVLGGAGSYQDMSELVKRFGVIGLGAGSLFVFKGKFRAVLIQYPGKSEKLALQQMNPLQG